MQTELTAADAIGEFAFEYGAQNCADYRTFFKAIGEGRITTHVRIMLG